MTIPTPLYELLGICWLQCFMNIENDEEANSLYIAITMSSTKNHRGTSLIYIEYLKGLECQS